MDFKQPIIKSKSKFDAIDLDDDGEEEQPRILAETLQTSTVQVS